MNPSSLKSASWSETPVYLDVAAVIQRWRLFVAHLRDKIKGTKNATRKPYLNPFSRNVNKCMHWLCEEDYLYSISRPEYESTDEIFVKYDQISFGSGEFLIRGSIKTHHVERLQSLHGESSVFRGKSSSSAWVNDGTVFMFWDFRLLVWDWWLGLKISAI